MVSTKAQAILDEIQGLPPAELRELCRQVNRLAAETENLASPPAEVSEGEFEAALGEVTGCTAGSNGLQRLLEDRRRDRERDEAWLETRKREPPPIFQTRGHPFAGAGQKFHRFGRWCFC